jgi:hypothetical protein
MTPARRRPTDARNVIPIPERESGQKPDPGTDSTGQFGYNRDSNPDQPAAAFHEKETRRGRSPGTGDITVAVPSRPPVITPQVGRVLLQVLLKAAQDTTQDAVRNDERKAA